MAPTIKRLFRNWNKRKCPQCGDKHTISNTKEIINGIIAEEAIYCAQCKMEVNYWAYGEYQLPNSKTEFIHYAWGTKKWAIPQRVWIILQELW